MATTGPHYMALDLKLLEVLTAGNAAGLRALLRSEDQTSDHVAVNVVPPSCLLGVTSNGNTALHLVASRGHAELAALICERTPSLTATRNTFLDTPLHCAAKAGHREVAACLVSTMRTGGVAEELAALNCLGATALHEAVRHRCAGVVDLLMTKAPKLASLATEDGSSPLYLAASTDSVNMVRALLQQSQDGTPSPASFSGPEGRTALHAAAAFSHEMAQEILSWKPKGPTLLTRVDTLGRTPLQFAVMYKRPDAVRLFLNDVTSAEQVRIRDSHGLFPVHTAAMVGSIKVIETLIKKCPDYYQMVDDKGRNFLHCAVEHNQGVVVDHICQNYTFATLLNGTDYEGNTPLHLAVKHSFPEIVSILLQTMRVEINTINKYGLTARDLALAAGPSLTTSLWSPGAVVFFFLSPPGATFTLDGYRVREREEEEAHTDGSSMSKGGTIRSVHPPLPDRKQTKQQAFDEEHFSKKPTTKEQSSNEEKDFSKTGTIGSVLIATVAFAAAFTVPGGVVADDRPGAGAAVMARRFAFRAFVVSDTMAFLCSIVATCFLIYSGTKQGAPRMQREWYSSKASALLPMSAVFTIAAFPFGFHLVLGSANRGLVIFVYALSSASLLFCIPGIWDPLRIGMLKAVRRRAGWRAVAWSFLYVYIGVPLFLVLISATFAFAIALDIALPNS